MYWWIWLIIVLFFLGMSAKSFFELKREEMGYRQRAEFEE